MSNIVHTSAYQPKVFPYNGSATPSQIDRAQEISSGLTSERTKVEELGTDGIVDWIDSIPSVTPTLRQMEYGEMNFFNQLANQAVASSSVELKDFKTTQVSIAAYETDEDDNFLGTTWYPNLRLTGFSLNLADPNALIERNFTFIGEDKIVYQGNNQYLIYLEHTMVSGETGSVDIVIGSGDYADYPSPVLDPDTSGTYFDSIIRVRSGTATELVFGTDYTYNSGTDTITIVSAAVGDVVKCYYTATTYITGEVPFTSNTSDLGAIRADSASLYLGSGNYLYKLQSATLDVSWERNDVKELGNSEVVARGVNDITTTITLGRVVATYTLDEVLRGESADYGKIDVREFANDIVFYIYIYSDKTKDTFKIGYKLKDLSASALDDGATINDYLTEGNTLTGEEGMIADNIAELVAYT